MKNIKIFQMPIFNRAYKKLHTNQKLAVDEAVALIAANPTEGEAKKGDLAGVYVYKFSCVKQQFLLAYEFDQSSRTLLCVGVHENFYRNLKR